MRKQLQLPTTDQCHISPESSSFQSVHPQTIALVCILGPCVQQVSIGTTSLLLHFNRFHRATCLKCAHEKLYKYSSNVCITIRKRQPPCHFDMPKQRPTLHHCAVTRNCSGMVASGANCPNCQGYSPCAAAGCPCFVRWPGHTCPRCVARGWLAICSFPTYTDSSISAERARRDAEAAAKRRGRKK